MINILLVFDNADECMGSFNQGCLEDYQDYFENCKSQHNITYVESQKLNDLNIQLRTENLDAFAFVAYSHGEHDRLFSAQGDYISTNLNSTNFAKSFFYTVSCLAGSGLGNCLIERGCHCFFGYRTLFNFWMGYKSFSFCANWGFFLFLDGLFTNDIYNKMLEEYNKHIDDMYPENYLVASLLMDNRDALVYLGNNVSINDFRKTNN